VAGWVARTVSPTNRPHARNRSTSRVRSTALGAGCVLPGHAHITTARCIASPGPRPSPVSSTVLCVLGPRRRGAVRRLPRARRQGPRRRSPAGERPRRVPYLANRPQRRHRRPTRPLPTARPRAVPLRPAGPAITRQTEPPCRCARTPRARRRRLPGASSRTIRRPTMVLSRTAAQKPIEAIYVLSPRRTRAAAVARHCA